MQTPEETAAKRREYRRKNRKKIAERQRKYREKNREKILKQQREYREKNREKLRAYYREYYKKNREAIVAHQYAKRTGLPIGFRKLKVKRRCSNGHLCKVWPCLICNRIQRKD